MLQIISQVFWARAARNCRRRNHTYYNTPLPSVGPICVVVRGSSAADPVAMTARAAYLLAAAAGNGALAALSADHYLRAMQL